MEIMSDFPERCTHPMDCLELLHAKEEQTDGGAFVADAIIHCHKCGKYMHMCSDYNGPFDRFNLDNVDIIPRCTGYL
jgi:hypothetical protein